MSEYRVRKIVPSKTDWFIISGNSVEEAINHHHYDNCYKSIDSIAFFNEKADGKTELVYFAKYEIDGGDEFVSRIFYSGILRRGSKLGRLRLHDVATKLGWEHNPQELLEYFDGQD